MRLIVTAGGTSEPIDRVRKITNMSKGTLGVEIVKKALLRDETVEILLLAPSNVHFKTDDERFKHVVVNSTQDVSDALQKLLTEGDSIDAVIHSMAISDYTVDYVFDMTSLAARLEEMQSDNVHYTREDYLHILQEGAFKIDNSSKISSINDHLTIKLKKTEKIISHIKTWSPQTKLMGFKLLENVTQQELIEVAKAQQEKNDCDFVFANDIARIRENGHQGYLLYPNESVEYLFGLEEIASKIVEVLHDNKVK